MIYVGLKPKVSDTPSKKSLGPSLILASSDYERTMTVWDVTTRQVNTLP